MSLTERGKGPQEVACLCGLCVVVFNHKDTKANLAPGEVSPRIHRPVVQPNLVVEVRRRASARTSDETDDFVLLNPLSHMDVEAGKVAVACGQAVTMINDDQVAVSCFSLRVDNDTVRRSQDAAAVKRRNV